MEAHIVELPFQMCIPGNADLSLDKSLPFAKLAR
jgi:hypothetical protein